MGFAKLHLPFAKKGKHLHLRHALFPAHAWWAAAETPPPQDLRQMGTPDRWRALGCFSEGQPWARRRLRRVELGTYTFFPARDQTLCLVAHPPFSLSLLPALQLSCLRASGCGVHIVHPIHAMPMPDQPPSPVVPIPPFPPTPGYGHLLAARLGWGASVLLCNGFRVTCSNWHACRSAPASRRRRRKRPSSLSLDWNWDWTGLDWTAAFQTQGQRDEERSPVTLLLNRSRSTCSARNSRRTEGGDSTPHKAHPANAAGSERAWLVK